MFVVARRSRDGSSVFGCSPRLKFGQLWRIFLDVVVPAWSAGTHLVALSGGCFFASVLLCSWLLPGLPFSSRCFGLSFAVKRQVCLALSLVRVSALVPRACVRAPFPWLPFAPCFRVARPASCLRSLRLVRCGGRLLYDKLSLRSSFAACKGHSHSHCRGRNALTELPPLEFSRVTEPQ